MKADEPQAQAVTRDGNSRRSAAQRQREYRLRCKRAVTDAIGEERSASRVTLLNLLGDDLAALDARSTPATLIGARRSSVKRVLNTIVTRYGIDLSD